MTRHRIGLWTVACGASIALSAMATTGCNKKSTTQPTPGTAASAKPKAEDTRLLSEKQPLMDRMVREIAAQAYVYAYPLVLMDVTREVLTAVARPQGMAAPINQVGHSTEFATPHDRTVIRPNVDTLYSAAWIDLSKQPLLLTVGSSDGRYYVIQLLDAWTNVFAAPGTRTESGPGPHEYALVGPYYRGAIPKGVTELRSPTNMVWMVGRISPKGSDDKRHTNRFQKSIQLKPLASRGRAFRPGMTAVNKDIDRAADPPVTVAKMSAEEFYTRFAELLIDNPPLEGDADIVEALRRLGISPGERLQYNTISPHIRAILANSVPAGQKRIVRQATYGTVRSNGWELLPDETGDYGADYALRAGVAAVGLGANLPEDAVYPMTSVDGRGKKLSSKYSYKVHFDSPPPVGAFWSMTLYDTHGYLVSNDIDRHAVGSQSHLERNGDGSIDIYIQPHRPLYNAHNWLPSPERGAFSLTLRLYLPNKAVLRGDWKPPTVERIRGSQRAEVASPP